MIMYPIDMRTLNCWQIMEQENSLIPEEEIKNPEILETSTNDEPVVAESKR